MQKIKSLFQPAIITVEVAVSCSDMVPFSGMFQKADSIDDSFYMYMFCSKRQTFSVP